MGVADVKYNSDIQAAVAGADLAPAPLPDVIEFGSGAKLRTKKVPILRIQAIMDTFKYPPIPEFMDEERKRPIKNPDHPEYKRMRDEVDEQRGLAALDALIAFGTELVSIPEGMAKPEDDSWIEECALFGLEVRTDSPKARYLGWVKFVAITDSADFDKLYGILQHSMGVSGVNIAQAISSFQSDQEPRPDNGSIVKE